MKNFTACIFYVDFLTNVIFNIFVVEMSPRIIFEPLLIHRLLWPYYGEGTMHTDNASRQLWFVYSLVLAIFIGRPWSLYIHRYSFYLFIAHLWLLKWADSSCIQLPITRHDNWLARNVIDHCHQKENHHVYCKNCSQDTPVKDVPWQTKSWLVVR